MIAARSRQTYTVLLESTGSGQPVDFWQTKALEWASSRFDHVVFFTNNQSQLPDFSLPYGSFPSRLAAGVYKTVAFPPDLDPFSTLFQYHRQHPDFLIGYLGYDLKNRIEPLQSRHADTLHFPEIYFFEPLHVIDFENDRVTVRSHENPQEVMDAIGSFQSDSHRADRSLAHKKGDTVQCRVTPDEYRETVRQIKQDIVEGTVYELNYCIEFFLEKTELDPLAVYSALSKQSPMPFSHFQRIGHQYVIGASPERFLKKEGNRLISQPIKGTIRRGQTADENRQLRDQLRNSEKEQAENLMIVDLVRNDLARSAETGTVQVDELFGIYEFQPLFQMISTVSATLRSDVPFTDAIRNAFPMGSMTGAPKVRAMELIDQYEASRRGLYAGAAGFITPEGDFDFNVMIRSIFYNHQNRSVSFSVGSAITYDADPQEEYEECLLKANAIMSVF
ncbi:anthranilate synthase component I family protein [Larkinella rosea]|uniref:Anthranilate synthase component I family protein n=1 Tax=Larkinella rosea TaxID=2025312 RepID=A0A3P1C148_9BACT|nr:anthranilate synthase component I family protein [Larkinella rosea]RRB06793.1 anthranilate synthase component I family protein [Larkinella rosea]